MSSINAYRGTGPEDYLAKGEKDRRASKLGNTAQRNYTPMGSLPADSEVTVTTLAEIDPDTLEATTSVTVTTLAERTTFDSGAFQWCNPDGTGTDNSQPILWGFFDWGNARGTGDSV